MNNLSLEILLVEDNPTDVLLLRDALDQVPTITFVLSHVERLDEALKCLNARSFDAVLLDLGLPDSQGLATLAQMQSLHPGIPIMVLSGLGDENITVEAVRSGAQDYLVKGSCNGTMIALTIRYAIERKRSEQRLRTAEVNYRRLFETAQDGIFLLDADTGQITDANPALQTLLGYTIAEFLGKRLWEIAPFRDKTANRAAFRTLQEDDPIRYEDLTLAAKNGRFIPVEFCSNVYVVGTNRVIQCNVRDITGRKAAEEAMEIKSREIISIWESITDAFFILDKEWRFTHINPQATLLVQKTKEELMGVNIWDTFPQSFNTKVAYNEYHRAMREQIPVRFEDFSQQLGKLFEVYAYPSSVGLSVYFRDISERKETEAQLIFQKTLLEAQSEASLDGILVVSAEAKILSYNQRLLQMWEISHPIFPDGDDAPLLQACLGKVTDPQNFLAKAIWLYNHRGEQSYDEIRLLNGKIFDRYSAPVISSTGTYYGRVWYFRDITERKRAETLLTESQHRLALATESAHIGIWDWDIVANKMVWDTQMFALYGISTDDFSGAFNAWEKGLHPEDRDSAKAELNAALNGDNDFHAQFRVVWSSGEVRHIEAHALVQRAPDGSALRMTGVNWDITERKEADAKQNLLVQGLNQVVTVAYELLAAPDLDHLLRQSVELARERLGFERCSLFLIDQKSQKLCGTYGTLLSGKTSDERELRFPLAGFWAEQLLLPRSPHNPDNQDLDDMRDQGKTIHDQKRWALDANHHLTEYDVQGGEVSTSSHSVVAWVGATSILSGEGVIGVLFNDPGYTNLPVDETKQELLVVYCSLLGSLIERLRTHERLQQVVKGAHCLLWEASVEAQRDTFFWDMTVPNANAAQDYLPLTITPGGTYYDSFYSAKHEADEERMATTANEAIRSGKPGYTQEYRVRALDGTIRWLYEDVRIEPQEPGQWHLIGVCTDITQRKQAEESLRRSEERYRSLALTTNQIVWVTNADGFVEDIPAWRKFTGQSIDEVRGWGWIEALHPDDREATLRIWAQSVETSRLYETEYRIRAANGEYRLFAVRGVPVLERDGSIREWVGTCTDIHDIRKAQEERDRFFTLSLDMLVIIGSDGYIKRLNPAFETTLGFTPAEMMAVPFMEFVHPEDRIVTQAEAAKIATGERVVLFENRYRCRDGSYKRLQWTCAPHEGSWYCAAHDITDITQIAMDLQKANDELEMRVDERTAELQAEVLERERAEEKVREQARRHEAVAELGRQALLNLDLNPLIESAVALISTTLELNHCAYWKRIPGSDTLREQIQMGLGPERQRPPDKTIGGDTQIGYTALGTVPVISADLERETRFRPALYLLELGITSSITVPVRDGVLYGVLAVASPDKQKFSQIEVNFLEAIANVLSSAIARKQSEAENLLLNTHLQGANDELRTNEAHLLQGNRISTELMRLRVRTHDELQSALNHITEAASVMLSIERSSVWLFNEDSTVIRCHDLYERGANRHSIGSELNVDENYFLTIKAQYEVVAEDARTNPLTSAFSESYLKPHGIASILDVALVVGGKHIGVLCCEHVGTPRQWQAEDRTFANALASITSLVLESYERARVETDLQTAKEEAEQATDEANAANHAKSEFLSRMSHELRTPLNAILGFGQILDKQDLGPLGKESVGYILKGGHHLLGLINEVLDIARVEAGRVDLSVEPIALDDIVVEACAMMWPLATERNIQIEENTTVHGHKNSLHVMADRQRFKQVLINLLSNAIKYNREGGQVQVTCAQNPNGWITIAVHDTGIGIAPHDLPKLFTPFQRLSASDSEIEGTGLGLVLSQRLITAMGGTLEVESVLGHGTTFTIALPGAISPEARVASSPEAARPFGAVLETEFMYTVLCIEDNLSNLRLMEVLLQSRPEITLLVAMQGGIGLDMARQHEPDLILLDLNLPDIHGKDVLARLQQSALTRNIPVVVISADATPNQVERLLAAGAKTYLTKPLDVEQFLHTLDTYLRPSVTGALQPDNEAAK